MNRPDAPPPEFTGSEVWTLHETLRERYGHDVEQQFGDTEMRLNRQDRELRRQVAEPSPAR